MQIVSQHKAEQERESQLEVLQKSTEQLTQLLGSEPLQNEDDAAARLAQLQVLLSLTSAI